MNRLRKLFSKHKQILTFLLVFIIVMGTTGSKSHAHRAYFLQVLIDEGQKVYVGNIIKDSSLKESKKTEAGLWKYDGEIGTNYKEFDDTSNGKHEMFFTFPSKPYKYLDILASRNNATAKDADRAYTISDTLIPNLNEMLSIMNGGKKYETTEKLIEASEKLIGLYSNGKGSISTPTGSISYSGGNKMTVTNPGGDSIKYLVRMKKGYVSEKLEDGSESPLYDPIFPYENDTDYISIADIMIQGNYTREIKGHTAGDASEYSKPGTMELKASEFLSSILYSLRSLLGLRDISEVVYSKGITGSSMYYGGVMPMSWMNNALKFHMLFQGLTWVALSIALVKLLLQRNLATINPSSRISLIDGIKDLLVAGFMLIAVFLIINLGLSVNEKIVKVFATTIPDYSAFSGGNVDFDSFAGVLLQVYYLVITIYLNVLYIIRAISTAILIASAPFFIASIAFQGKNKTIFESWAKELLANIFLQSFHAFVLSFLLSAQMTAVRGIELAVVSFVLIPMTKWFRSLITGKSGELGENLGLAGVSMAGATAGGLVGGLAGRAKGSDSYKGASGGDSSGIKTKDSAGMSAKSAERSRNEHSDSTPSGKSTSDSMKSRQSNYSSMDSSNSDKNYEKLSKSGNIPSGDMSSQNIPGNKDVMDAEYSESKEGDFNPSEQLSKKPFKNVESFSKKDIGSAVKTAANVTKDVAVGGTKMTAGAAVALALGGSGGGASKAGANLMASGASDIGKGVKTAGMSAGTFAQKGINSAHSKLSNRYSDNQGGNILGSETLSNGDVAIHRDKDMLSSEGLSDIRKTSDNNIATTYNKENLTDENLENLNTIEKAYEEGKHDFLQSKGIENVTKTQDGNTVVHYNAHGQEQLGFKDAYTNRNRVVETKAPGQPLESKIIYDINSVGTATPDTNYSKGTKTVPEGGQSPYMQEPSENHNLSMDDIIE